MSLSTIAGYYINTLTVRMRRQKRRSAQHVVKPCIQPQNALGAEHREEARSKAKTKIKDSHNTTTQAIFKQKAA